MAYPFVTVGLKSFEIDEVRVDGHIAILQPIKPPPELSITQLHSAYITPVFKPIVYDNLTFKGIRLTVSNLKRPILRPEFDTSFVFALPGASGNVKVGMHANTTILRRASDFTLTSDGINISHDVDASLVQSWGEIINTKYRLHQPLKLLVQSPEGDNATLAIRALIYKSQLKLPVEVVPKNVVVTIK